MLVWWWSLGGPDALWSPGELRVMSGAKAGEAFSSTLSFVRSMEQLEYCRAAS